MTRDELINLVRTYFAGVDGEDLDKIFSTFTDDCRFTVETHGFELRCRDAIRGMFERLWSNHAAVRHDKDIVLDVDAAAAALDTVGQTAGVLPQPRAQGAVVGVCVGVLLVPAAGALSRRRIADLIDARSHTCAVALHA